MSRVRIGGSKHVGSGTKRTRRCYLQNGGESFSACHFQTSRPGRTNLPPWAYEPPALGVRTSRPGRTNLPPWAYEPPAVGVRTSRRGRTNLPPWAYEPLAVGVRTARRGHSQGAPCAYWPLAVGVLTALNSRTPPVLTPRTGIGQVWFCSSRAYVDLPAIRRTAAFLFVERDVPSRRLIRIVLSFANTVGPSSYCPQTYEECLNSVA